MTRASLFSLALVLSFTFFVGTSYGEVVDCSKIPGTRLATANDAVVKSGKVIINTCYNPKEYGIGQTAEEAKLYLRSLPRQAINNSRCAPPENNANIDKLNDTFAICAAQFLKAYIDRYGNGQKTAVLITSAFRDGAAGSAGDGSGKSANQCAGGAGQSNHTRAVAMDVNAIPHSMYPTMWKFASDNPQFGVCFPFQDKPLPGYPNGDRPHMILAGIGGSEGALCAKQGVTKACNGLVVDPKNITATPVQTATPSNTFANSLRNVLGMQQPQQQPFSQPAFSQQQNPLSAFQQPQVMQPTTGSVPQNVTTSGSSGLITGVTPSTGSTTNPNASIAQLLIDSLAATTPSPTTTTNATSVRIVINPQDVSSSSVTTVVSASGTPGYEYVPSTIATQQTFTSSELGQSVLYDNNYSAGYENELTILARLKSILEYLYQYLRPFGRPASGDGTA